MIESILFSMGMLLLGAKILGHLCQMKGIPSLTGEIIAGIIIGPILGLVIPGNFLVGFITFGLAILLFIAGTEVHYEDIKLNTYGASAVAIGGGVLSFALGYLVGIIYFNDWMIAFAIGTILVSTSNAALFSLLSKLGKTKSKVGSFILTATIADDIVGIFFVALFTYISKNFSIHATDIFNFSIQVNDMFKLVLLAIGFYFFVFTAGSKIVDKILKIAGRFRDENILLAIPLGIAFILSVMTNNFGLSMATGAFLAGAAISGNRFTNDIIVPKVTTLADGFAVPLSYAAIGTLIVLQGLNFFVVVAIFFAAVAGKFIGCSISSMFFGYNPKESTFIGLSLIPRGNENIAFAQIVFLSGLIAGSIYSSIILAIVLTAVTTPIFMKLAERGK